MEINKSACLNYSDGFDDKEEASLHYDEILEKINNIDKSIKLYRLVFYQT